MALSDDTVDRIRSASRRIVRDLGFMGGAFAGTDLPPSSVHALIEIGAGSGITAADLANRLRLEKSSVSRLLHKLRLAGDIAWDACPSDRRVRPLRLTDAGRRTLAGIDAFARGQVEDALDGLTQVRCRTIADGLSFYAAALAREERIPGDRTRDDGSRDSADPADDDAAADVAIWEGYRTGAIAAITGLHAAYYAKTHGFGRHFESIVASGLADFCHRLHRPDNGLWLALQGHRIVGSIAIDGEDLGKEAAHLRWFIVGDDVRGQGVGRRLLERAVAFADRRSFPETRLWTFAGLESARHLYEAAGFRCTQEQPGRQWGTGVLEQRFIRPRPTA